MTDKLECDTSNLLTQELVHMMEKAKSIKKPLRAMGDKMAYKPKRLRKLRQKKSLPGQRELF